MCRFQLISAITNYLTVELKQLLKIQIFVRLHNYVFEYSDCDIQLTQDYNKIATELQHTKYIFTKS